MVNTKLDERKPVLCVFIDFSKAFDLVDHKMLLCLLEQYGVRGVALRWFENYLSRRRFRVKIGNHIKDKVLVESGVLEGSILGPILYLLHVNDICNCFTKCGYYLSVGFE